MLIADHKNLIKRLSKNILNALEVSVGRCVSMQQYEIVVEHVVVALLDDASSDLAGLVGRTAIDARAFRSSLESQLANLRTGSTARPTFSPLLMEWVQDAWVFGSINLSETVITSGAMLHVLAANPAKYSAAIAAAGLGAMKEELKTIAASCVFESKEATSPRSTWPAATVLRHCYCALTIDGGHATSRVVASGDAKPTRDDAELSTLLREGWRPMREVPIAHSPTVLVLLEKPFAMGPGNTPNADEPAR